MYGECRCRQDLELVTLIPHTSHSYLFRSNTRLMAEYNFIFETPYMIPINTAYPCTVDRPKEQRKQV